MEYEFVICKSCGKQNRVSTEKIELGLQPKCGECGQPLAAEENGRAGCCDGQQFFQSC